MRGVTMAADFNPMAVYEQVRSLPLQDRRGVYAELCLTEDQESQIERWLAQQMERTKPIAHDPSPPSSAIADKIENIGPYRVVERLGEGGMGIVYKAEQRTPIRRTVAVKVIKLGFDSAEVIARFESERQALA